MMLAGAGGPRRRKLAASAIGAAALGFAAVYFHRKSLEKSRRHRGGGRTKEKKDGSLRKKRGGGKSSKKVLAMLLKGSIPSLAALAGLACTRTLLANRLSTVQGGLFRTAFLRQKKAFLRLLGENFFGCLLLSYLQSQFTKITQGMEMSWRSRLTGRVHDKYFNDMNYYKCSHVDKSVANPEQIICEDVPKYCSGMAQCTGEVIGGIVDVLFYSQRLGSYTRSHRYTLAMCGYIFGAGTLVKLASPNFAKMYKRKQALEGSYRMAQTRLKSNSESVAFYKKGIVVEAETIQQRLAQMVAHNSKLLFNTWRFSMVQDLALKYFGATFAVILIIGPFFEGHLRPNNTMKGRADMLSNMRYHTGVVISLFTAFGVLGNMPNKTSKMRAYVQRIGGLMDAMQATPQITKSGEAASEERTYKSALTQDAPPGDEAPAESPNSIVFKNATVKTPAGHTLIRDLNLVIEEGTNLLVTGPNGAGKSSLFRVLGGLWQLEEGFVSKPRRNASDRGSAKGDEGLAADIFYVPQKPFVSVGTLIGQLIYPSTVDKDRKLVDNPELLRELLRKVDLLYLLTDFGRYSSNAEDDISVSSKDSSDWSEDSVKKGDLAVLDASTTVVNWAEVLSLGEQQRLGMARLFYHKPRFAILDECTSGVTNDMEERFCEIVESMGCTCITISHRPALVAFHDKVLHLDGEGGWTLNDLKHSNEASSSEEDEEESDQDQSDDITRSTDSKLVYEAMIKKSKSKKLSKHGTGQSTQHLGALINEHKVKAPKGMSSASLYDDSLEVKAKGKHSMSDMFKLVSQLLASGKKKLSWQGSDAVHLSALAACVVLRTAISDRIANLNGQTVFFVINQDRSGFYKLMITSAMQSISNSVIASSLKYLTDHLALGWRQRLTDLLLDRYFKKDTYYRSVHIQHLRDVDQRITRDVERWCDDLAALVPCAIKPVLDAAWFSWRCYKLTGKKGVAFLYFYMAFGYTTLKAISPDLAMASRGEHDLESAFRQSHIALRERAESVAFFGGGQREKYNIHQRFAALKNHVLGTLSKRFNHDIYENFLTNHMPHNITWIVSMIFSLQYPIDIRKDVIEQAAMVKDMRYLATVIAQTFSSFGDILGLHQRYTELAGGATRISEVFKEMKKCRKVDNFIHYDDDSRGKPGLIYSQGSNAIEFDDANVETPSGSILAQNLSLSVPLDKNLLISGPNASGKTSLVRCVAGLWPMTKGHVRVPHLDHRSKQLEDSQIWGVTELDHRRPALFVVTQKPYTTLGSLRAQILYPHSPDDAGTADESLDAQLEDLLDKVHLKYLVERWGWDSVEDWENVLSLGEQQRLGMARLFYHKPHWCFLDECTNAVSADVEEELYKFARDLGITMLTITQRSGLLEYHDEELKLKDGAGSWEHFAIRY
ncbi:type I ABC transporter [Chloropicon primus]|nr:type I ABC transporter [Chloropicon primus]